MARPRKKDKHLPPCVYFRHGGYYHVKAGNWTLLARDLPSALHEYGRRFSERSGGLDAHIDRAMLVVCKEVAANTSKQYHQAAAELKHMLGNIPDPADLKPRDVVAVKRQLADTPNYAN